MVDLKIRKVVLYKTGLGFFEKQGVIDLQEQKQIKITFQNSTMNDLLKTFSILRISGDLTVASVSYEGQDTNAAKMLQDSIIKLPEEDTLNTLISQLRGFKIGIQSGSTQLSGTIVGIQEHEEPVSERSDGTILEQYILLKDNKGKILRIKIKDLHEIKILDDIAQNDFDFFMDVVQSLKNDKYRNVNIYFSGEEKSEFLLTFLQEIPAFKVSWRLYLRDIESAEEDEEGDLEIPITIYGWAIIDNILDEDWEGISLSLMSGLPISFKYDSYSPLYISRPTVRRTQNLSVKQTASPPPPPRSRKGGSDKQTPHDPLQVVNKIVSNSNVKGSGYKYDIPMPVTVKRKQSSLIPILQTKSTAKMVSVYNEDNDKTRAMSTLEITNDTDMILEEGPISVYLDDVFQGEAVLPFLEKDETQRIPYAINQSIEVNKIVKTKSTELATISLKSEIHMRYYIFRDITYELKNVSAQRQILIIEHPKGDKWKIYESEEPLESTANYHRFKVHFTENESKKLKIRERKSLGELVEYKDIDDVVIGKMYDKKLISEKEYGHLKKLIEYQKEQSRIQAEITSLNFQQDRISKEQERIRKNMKVLGKSKVEKELRGRYVEKFQSGETKMEEIDESIRKLEKDREKQRKLWNDYRLSHFSDES